MWAPKIWKVGVTGGIGAGKSNIVRIISGCGAAVIDADKLGHRTYEPGTDTFNKLTSVFGPSIVDDVGQINRKALGALGINQLARQEILTYEAEGKKVVFLEAAVLVEANWFDLVDEVWVATVPPSVAKRRIMERNTLTETQAEERIKSQITNEERTRYADIVIATDRPKEETEVIVKNHYSDLMAKLDSSPDFKQLRNMKSKM